MIYMEMFGSGVPTTSMMIIWVPPVMGQLGAPMATRVSAFCEVVLGVAVHKSVDRPLAIGHRLIITAIKLAFG
jgi:hypothetical protein